MKQKIEKCSNCGEPVVFEGKGGSMKIYGVYLDQLGPENIGVMLARADRDYQEAKEREDWEACRRFSYWIWVLRARE